MDRINLLAREGKINENANIRDQHSIIINAPIKKIWTILTNLRDWINWNKQVKIMKVDGSEIGEGTKFQWMLGRFKSNAQIQRIEMPHIFSWTEKSNWIKRIYAWTLESDDDQTIVSVSTSLEGRFTFLMKNHQKVYDELLNWLEYLKQTAEKE